MKKNLFKSIIENIQTIFYALIIATIIRSLFFQPFYIPSSSMEPTLLIGDRIFVSKYTYGYSKHSFPFSPPLFKNRLFEKEPNYGDLVVFKTPSDNRTDYIKRLIGMPGDTVQFVNGQLFLNNKEIIRKIIRTEYKIRCGQFSFDTNAYLETLPNGIEYTAVYNKLGTMQNTEFNINTANTNYVKSLDAININDSDVWLYKLDQFGLLSEAWTKVPSLSGNNAIYNSLSKAERNTYNVVTKNNDAIDLVFGDGNFSNLPLGNFRIYYRTSDNAKYAIQSADMQNIQLTVPYTDANAQ